MIPEIIGVMAATADGVVGDKGGLPWHYPEETDYFRRLVQGHMLVMGRKTFAAAPQALLQGRTSIVFTHDPNPVPNVVTVRGKNEFLSYFASNANDKPVYMIGGAQMAHYFIRENLLSEFLLTHIHKPYKGDVILDLALLEKWPATPIDATKDYTINRLINPFFKEP